MRPLLREAVLERLMITRSRTLAIVLGAAAVVVVIVRHAGGAIGRSVPGGILIGDVALYDAR